LHHIGEITLVAPTGRRQLASERWVACRIALKKPFSDGTVAVDLDLLTGTRTRGYSVKFTGEERA